MSVSSRVCAAVRYLTGCGLFALAAFATTAAAEMPPTTAPPASPAAPPAPEPEAIASRPRDADDGRAGPLGPIEVGVLGGVSFPRPLSIAAMVRLRKTVAVGLEYSLLPKISTADVSTTFYALAGDVRVFPFRNAFFVGLGAGHQHLGATASVGVAQLGSIGGGVTADTWFVNPRLGFLWTYKWGLTLGLDAGVQIPVATSFTNTIPSLLSARQEATDLAHLFGKDVLPTVDLLRIGLVL
jgi:hypothetical protein